MNYKFINVYSEDKSFKGKLKENKITILVGRNGHGKTAFLQSLKQWCDKNDYPNLYWSDSQYGRNNGMQTLLMNNRIEELAGMAFRSEGQALFQSFTSFFVGKAGRFVRQAVKDKKEKIFFLIDQLDSGLDIYQIAYIKQVIRDIIIPDVSKSGLICFFVISANSFQTIYSEDVLDPVSGIHYKFTDLEQFKQFIEEQYKEDENDRPKED